VMTTAEIKWRRDQRDLVTLRSRPTRSFAIIK
jgi:hypothetical protein